MKIILLIILIIFTKNLKAQHWLPVEKGVDFFSHCFYSDTIDNLLYLAGDSPNYNAIKSWNGLQFSNIGRGVYGEVHSIVRYKNEIYLGGEIRNVLTEYSNFDVGPIIKWNGTNWTDIAGTRDINYIGTMEIFNDELYAGGMYNKIGNIEANCIARWNGTTWQNVGEGVANTEPMNGSVNCMASFEDELYVAGSFTRAGSILANNIAKWDGNTWYPLGNGVDFRVTSMIFYKNDLYISGLNDSNIGQIMKWNGTLWEPVTNNGLENSGLNTYYDLEVFKDELYLCGNFRVGNVSRNIAKFNGTEWIPVTSSGVYENEYFDGYVYCMSVFDSSLYLGGYFKKAEDIEVKNITRYTDEIPKPSFSLSTSLICTGYPWATIINSSDNAPTDFEWFIPGATPYYSNKLTPGLITFNGSGEYTITLKVSNPNGIDSISKVVIVHESPQMPVISVVSDSLLVSGYEDNNQWYWNNKPLIGETNDTLIYDLRTLGKGTIQVGYTDSTGCMSLSTVLTDTHEIEKKELISVNPNPFSSGVYIEMINNKRIDLEIINQTGKIVYKKEINYSGFIDLTFLPNDIYFFRITGNAYQDTKKMIKIF